MKTILVTLEVEIVDNGYLVSTKPVGDNVPRKRACTSSSDVKFHLGDIFDEVCDSYEKAKERVSCEGCGSYEEGNGFVRCLRKDGKVNPVPFLTESGKPCDEDES
ncbi:MAG: hypothetical protein BA863_02185 [Desulfovibrio sp. S3730MH75]|nr:MAG: hypothetical protein BA863_02185 [Desulfovibrio sp. S3730MH75]